MCPKLLADYFHTHTHAHRTQCIRLQIESAHFYIVEMHFLSVALLATWKDVKLIIPINVPHIVILQLFCFSHVHHLYLYLSDSKWLDDFELCGVLLLCHGINVSENIFTYVVYYNLRIYTKCIKTLASDTLSWAFSLTWTVTGIDSISST